MENLNIKNSYCTLQDYTSTSREDKIFEVLWNFRKDVFKELDLVKKLIKSLQTSINSSYTEVVNNDNIYDNSLSTQEQSNILAEDSSMEGPVLTFESNEQFDIPMHTKDSNITVKEEYSEQVIENWNVKQGNNESNMKTIMPFGINSVYTVDLSSTSESPKLIQPNTIEPNMEITDHGLNDNDQFALTEICIIVDDISIHDFDLRSQNMMRENETTELMKDTLALQKSLEVSVSPSAIKKCLVCNKEFGSKLQFEEYLTEHAEKGVCM